MFMPMGFDKQAKGGGGGFLDSVLGGIGGLFGGGGPQQKGGGGGFGGIGSAIGGLFGPLGGAVGGALGGLFGGGGAKSQDKAGPPTGLIDWDDFGGKGGGGLEMPGPWGPGSERYDDPNIQYFSSDERLKTDIRPILNALDLIAKL
jgi:hypothetical protein